MSASRKKLETALRRWGLFLLAAALLCTLWPGNATRAEEDSAAIAFPYHKDSPLVTVQGNIVEDNGKATGFYELALCVQTKYITAANGTLISQEEYDALDEAQKADYTVHNATDFSFQSVAASLKINTDVLTPVRWDAAYPEYATWNGTAYEENDYNAASRNTHFARGLNLNTADVTNIRGADYHSQARLDTAKPDEINAATALVEYYNDETDETAILTLSATAPAEGVVYDKMTEVVVVRFAYDLKRFENAYDKFGVWENTTDTDDAPVYDAFVTYLSTDGEAAKSSVNQSVWFQAGLKKNADPTQLPPDYTMFYYYQGANYGATQKDTTDNTKDKKVDVNIKLQGGGAQKVSLALPATAGRAVLTENTDPTVSTTDPNKYSYLKNLLRTTEVGSDADKERQTLFFKKVHQETYRKPTGGTGGTQILFYDWDDTLIGSLIVDKGDVRAEVNQYVEEHMVHPDLRASKWAATVSDKTKNPFGMEIFQQENYDTMVSGMGETGEKIQSYKNVLDSLDREYTYRGKYSYVPGQDTNSANMVDDGEKYPLTNKLDYAFYRRVNTVTTAEDGTQYYTVQPVSADENSALYPYVYGWAVVEDDTVANLNDWYLRKDAVTTEGVWTTFGIGEFSSDNAAYSRPAEGAEPNKNAMPEEAKSGVVSFPGGLAKTPACAADTTSTASILSAVTAVEQVAAPLEEDAVPMEDALTPEIPQGEDAMLAPEEAPAEDAAIMPETMPVDMLAEDGETVQTKAPENYFFRTSADAGSSYLKFADFSDVDAMLTVDPVTGDKKDVLIVKAVYEQGRSLMPNDNYRVVDGSLNMERYSTTASTNSATYSFQYQYERANVFDSAVKGVGRVREPGIQTGMIYDVEEFGSDNNPNQLFYIKNITTNTDIMDVDLTVSGVIWRINYVLVDLYNRNIATGVVRSLGKELKLDDNFDYAEDTAYENRQGTNGFVMQATMNTLLKEANAGARNQSNSLAENFKRDTLTDLNLRRNEDGDEFDSMSNWSACSTYLQNLVTNMHLYRENHPGALAQYFDEKGNAVLTWHQLQREIIMQNAGQGSIFDSTTGTIMSNEDCAGFTWCRLCTKDTDPCKSKTIVILTYGDMFKALAVEKSQPDKYQEAIDGWKTSGAKTFDFCKNEEGIPYNISTDAGKEKFVEDMRRAYKLLTNAGITEPWKASWKVVQEAIAQDKYNDTPTFNYWWGPEGTPPVIKTWDDLLKYAIQEYIGVDTDDDNIPDTKLTGAFAGFDQEDLNTLVSVHKAGEPVNLGYFRTGVIDPADDEHAMEFEVEAFKTALEKALKALTTAPAPYGPTVDSVKTAPWEEIQYALIAATGKYPGEPAYKNLTQINGDGYDYWWKDGGKPKLTYEKFRPTLWDHAIYGPDRSQTVDLITSLPVVTDQLRFRADEYGGEFTSTELFLNRLYTVLRNVTRLPNRGDFMNDTTDGFDKMTWEELQWLLIYGETMELSSDAPSAENGWAVGGETIDPAKAFWWKEATGTPPKEPIKVNTISALLQGAKWTWTLPAVNDQALEGDGLVSEITALHLRKANGVPYTDKTEFLTDMKAAYTALVNGLSANKVTTATWAEVQYALIYKTFKAETAIRADAAVDFWWENGGKPTITDMTSLLKAAWYYYHGATDAFDDLSAEGKLDLINDSKDPLLRLRQNNDGAKWGTTKLNDLKDQLMKAVEALTTNGAPYTLETLGNATWEEIQYAVINGTYMSNDDIQAAITAGTIDYWWKTDDVKPGGEAQEKEITGDWTTFMEKISYYVCGTSKDKSKLRSYLGSNVALLNKDFLLRKDASGTEFTTVEEFTDLLELVKANVIKSGGAVFKKGEYDPDNTDKTQRLKLEWWQLQYALLHCSETDWAGREFPTEQELKDQAPYSWKIQQPPKQLDITGDWTTFMKNVSYYICGTSKDKSKLRSYLGTNITLLNKDFLLRKDASGAEFTTVGEFTDLLELVKANVIKSGGAVFKKGEYDPDNTDKTQRLKLEWWQLQYALLHCSETDWAGREFPTEQEIQDKLTENNYTWRFVDGYSGVKPTTARALSAPSPTRVVMWLPETASDCFTKLRAGMAAVAG